MAEILATEIRPGIFRVCCEMCEWTVTTPNGVSGVVYETSDHVGMEVIDVDQARDYLVGTEQLKIVRMEKT
jgi:hypothetical protein